jgi:hypothetical protein
MGAAAPFGWCEMRTSERRITYVPYPGVTAEKEVDALATVLRFVLDCHRSRKAAERSGRNDAKETHYARAKDTYTG